MDQSYLTDKIQDIFIKFPTVIKRKTDYDHDTPQIYKSTNTFESDLKLK